MLKDPVPLGEVRRALVIKLRHHGDVLLSAPVFSVLQAHAPHCEIDALVYADTAEMLSLHPAISTLHSIDRQWKKQGSLRYATAEWRLLQTLRARRYDLILHLTEHPRGAWLSRLLSARWAVAPKIDGRGRLWEKSFTHLVTKPRARPRHTVENNLDALRRIGIYPAMAERAVVLVAGPEAEARVDILLRERGVPKDGFVHIHPAARWLFKCWTAEGWAELIERLQDDGWPVVLSGAPSGEEAGLLQAIEERLTRPVVNLAGALSLKELAALAARARLFIGVDSAPMHIAAAMGTPVIALFGPSGEASWGPWHNGDGTETVAPHCVVASHSHSCRPCGIDGCGGGKLSDCLSTLPAAPVIEQALTLLTR
jgi:heptosyltransferase-3